MINKKTKNIFLCILAIVCCTMLSIAIVALSTNSKSVTAVTTMTEKGKVQISSHTDYAYVEYSFFYLNLVGSDYPSSSIANVSTKNCKLDELNFLDKILVNGKKLREYSTDVNSFDSGINKFQRYQAFVFSVPGISDVKTITTFEVEEGCQLPAYNDGVLGEMFYTVSKTYYYINEDLEVGYDIPDDAITITEKEDSIIYDIKFNFFLSNVPSGESVATSYILFNGKSFDEINNKTDYISAVWKSDTRLTLSITIQKTCPDLQNSAYRYVQNYFVFTEGMTLPESNKLDRSYRLCVYDDEIITELYKQESADSFATNQINGVTFIANDGTSDNAALIKVTFASAISNENVPAEGDYNILSSETWKNQSWNDKKVHSKHISRAFMHDGFKSSLYDNVLINGLSLAQWCGMADPKSTAKDYAIAVHYGEYGGKVMSIHFMGASTLTKGALIDSYNDGSLSITFKEGLKFVTGNMVKTEQKFVFRKSTESFVPATLKDFAVYYNGSNVEDNSTIEGYGIIDKNSLYITRDGNDYYVSFDTKKSGYTEVTIYLNLEKVFSFKIKRVD